MSLTSFDVFPVIKFVKTSTGPGRQLRTSANNKGYMKKFTIEVSHAAPGQLLTIAAELKIMSNNWEKFGPRILINGQKLQAPSLREPSHKRQASSSKRHNMARFI